MSSDVITLSQGSMVLYLLNESNFLKLAIGHPSMGFQPFLAPHHAAPTYPLIYQISRHSRDMCLHLACKHRLVIYFTPSAWVLSCSNLRSSGKSSHHSRSYSIHTLYIMTCEVCIGVLLVHNPIYFWLIQGPVRLRQHFWRQ